MGAAKIDPRLLQQTTAASGGIVRAVLTLGGDPAHAPPLSREDADALARQLLEGAKQATGLAPRKWRVYSNLGTVLVEAPPEFMKAILERPEIAAASAAPEVSEALITPVKKT